MMFKVFFKVFSRLFKVFLKILQPSDVCVAILRFQTIFSIEKIRFLN